MLSATSVIVAIGAAAVVTAAPSVAPGGMFAISAVVVISSAVFGYNIGIKDLETAKELSKKEVKAAEKTAEKEVKAAEKAAQMRIDAVETEARLRVDAAEKAAQMRIDAVETAAQLRVDAANALATEKDREATNQRNKAEQLLSEKLHLVAENAGLPKPRTSRKFLEEDEA
eukprot:tig00021434_g21374.t1